MSKFSTFFHRSTLNSQRGGLSLILIVLVVIVFAVMLAGGGGSLFSGNLPSPVASPTPGPSSSMPDAQPTASVSASPTPNSAWSITYTLEPGCANTNGVVSKKGEAKAVGPQDGYILLEVMQSGAYKQIQTRKYTAPQGFYPLDLKNSNGYNTSAWRITLYSGGTESSPDTWSGGIMQSETTGLPTSCF